MRLIPLSAASAPSGGAAVASTVDAASAAGDAPAWTLTSATLLLVCTATWALSHLYAGIVHDARLYALQALAHLDPPSLSRDIFLSFGSQDRFSTFSSLYAPLIGLMGMDRAAALVTLLSQLLFFGAAWFLVRECLSKRLALISMAILIAIPGEYGADRVFRIVEPFASPRLPAEALVIAALAAVSCGRTYAAFAFLFGAALLHPIIAEAGVLAMFCIHVAVQRPRVAFVIIVAMAVTLLVGAHAFSAEPFATFDSVWLDLVRRRSPYLFLSGWGLDEWGKTAVAAASLVAGCLVLPASRGRMLCAIALAVGMAGLALTLVACDVLHLVLFTQLQPWRSLWLAGSVAALALPLTLHHSWQKGCCGRAAALLLAASWVFGAGWLALVTSCAALVAAALVDRLRPNEARLILVGGCVALLLATAWRLASNLLFTDMYYYDPAIPGWMRRIMSFTHDGTVPAGIALLAWQLGRRRPWRPALLPLALLVIGLCACIGPTVWQRWTQEPFSSRTRSLLAKWRERIPPRAEVFWPELPDGPWLLLGRPSYLSSAQTAGLVFSRNAALEMQRRAAALAAAVPPSAFLDWNETGPAIGLTPNQMTLACRTGEFAFAITGLDLNMPAVASLSARDWPASHGLRLYRCSDPRS